MRGTTWALALVGMIASTICKGIHEIEAEELRKTEQKVVLLEKLTNSSRNSPVKARYVNVSKIISETLLERKADIGSQSSEYGIVQPTHYDVLAAFVATKTIPEPLIQADIASIKQYQTLKHSRIC